jgi:hypothetical protein
MPKLIVEGTIRVPEVNAVRPIMTRDNRIGFARWLEGSLPNKTSSNLA